MFWIKVVDSIKNKNFMRHNWIDLAGDNDSCQALVDAVMNLRVP